MKKIQYKSTLSSISWAFVQIKEGGGCRLLFLFLFIFVQGLFPSANLYILKSLTETIGTDYLLTKATWILGGWTMLVLLENIVTPLAQITRIKVNEMVYSYFSLMLMKKAN